MNDTQKTIAGTLMIGAGILSGNATLLSVAGGIGVNWASDGLIGLWDQAVHHFAPEEPLRRAYQRAITSAIAQLRAGYARQTGQIEAQTFDLLADCAGAVSQAQYPPDVVSVATAQHTLARELDNLLYAHPERVQTYVKQSLLDAVAQAFRDELAHDADAWRRFHGWLIEQLSANVRSHEYVDGARGRGADPSARCAGRVERSHGQFQPHRRHAARGAAPP